MIDKDRTISKAIAKFHEISPVPGKKSLYECFFSLRGEFLFQFRTSDKRIHTIKALEEKKPLPSFLTEFTIVTHIYKMLTEPLHIKQASVKKG